MKLQTLSPSTIKKVIHTLQAGLLYKEMLSPFELRFVVDISSRYGEFGTSLNITDAQISTINELSEKLLVSD